MGFVNVMKQMLLFISLCFVGLFSYAQITVGVNFQVGFPTGDWSIDKGTGFGGGIEGNYFLSESFSLGLEINAGHDLSLDNLKYFSENIPGLLEVSIGHALISESLYLGVENVINMYLNRLK